MSCGGIKLHVQFLHLYSYNYNVRARQIQISNWKAYDALMFKCNRTKEEEEKKIT